MSNAEGTEEIGKALAKGRRQVLMSIILWGGFLLSIFVVFGLIMAGRGEGPPGTREVVTSTTINDKSTTTTAEYDKGTDSEFDEDNGTEDVNTLGDTGVNAPCCETDADCIAVKADCCGCQLGGRQKAVSRFERAEYLNDLNGRCDITECPFVNSTHRTCYSTPMCINGSCVMVFQEDAVRGLERDSCRFQCMIKGYDNGFCRDNGMECRMNDEIVYEYGNRFCEDRRLDICCCSNRTYAGEVDVEYAIEAAQQRYYEKPSVEP
ncbi:MAG: hypothetical protein GF416_07080 [Candidatus Altiarchaeales archaeon]|nr:hypothetical protein [Candidatus Altiarchaeales archaeon]MBD3416876.1 hypothetical protein [Candidatus Altiarchaeales archaeon]